MKHLKEFRDHLEFIPMDGETYQIGKKSLYAQRNRSGAIAWRSYNTIVAIWSDGVLFTTDYKYSRTTSRHLSLIRNKGMAYKARREVTHWWLRERAAQLLT